MEVFPKTLYGELAAGMRGVNHPQLRFKDVCTRDIMALKIKIQHWDDLASVRSKWRSTLTRELKMGKERLTTAAGEKRYRRRAVAGLAVRSPSTSMTCAIETVTRALVPLVSDS